MKLTRVSMKQGRCVAHGIRIDFGGRAIFITGRQAAETARKIERKYDDDPRGFRLLVESIESYERFNRESPRKIKTRDLGLTRPLVRIGKVPEISYLSRKEGKTVWYVHRTKKMPTLYYDPRKKVGILLGGSIKVKDWLYD